MHACACVSACACVAVWLRAGVHACSHAWLRVHACICVVLPHLPTGLPNHQLTRPLACLPQSPTDTPTA